MERLTVSPELGEATQDFERARGEFFEQKFGISPTSLAAMEKAGLRTGIKVNFGAKAITLPDELERYAKEFFGENDYHVDSLDFAKEALYLRMSSYTGNVLQKSLRCRRSGRKESSVCDDEPSIARGLRRHGLRFP